MREGTSNIIADRNEDDFCIRVGDLEKSSLNNITKVWNIDINVILAWIMTLITKFISNFKLKALKYLVENVLQNVWILRPKIMIRNIGNIFITLYCLLVMYLELYFYKTHMFCSESSLKITINEIFQEWPILSHLDITKIINGFLIIIFAM